MEHYIYRFLIDWYYLDESPIPCETKSVARRLGIGSEETHFLQNVLDEFFEQTENGWVHHRIESEIVVYRERVLTAQANGRKGGRKRNRTVTKSVNSAKQKKANPKLTNNHKPINIYRENSEKKHEKPASTRSRTLADDLSDTTWADH